MTKLISIILVSLLIFYFSFKEKKVLDNLSFIKPVKLDINKIPRIKALIIDENRDFLNIKDVVSASLYDLGVTCNHYQLYTLSYQDMIVIDEKRITHDITALNSGSGGFQVVIFYLNKNSDLKIIYRDTLIDFYGALTKSDCPKILAARKQLNKNELFETKYVEINYNLNSN